MNDAACPVLAAPPETVMTPLAIATAPMTPSQLGIPPTLTPGSGQALASKVGVPLVSLEAGMPLDLAVDGADEVHRMVLNRHLESEGRGFFAWPTAEA